MNIVIIEDEKKLAASLKKGLEKEGYTVTVFDAAEKAEQYFVGDSSSISLAILDLMLPKRSGFEFCKSIRTRNISTPVLVLTALDTVEDKIAALDSGADDFMTKPFSFDELLARIRALSRRSSVMHSSVISLADVTLDPASQKVIRGKKKIFLTSREFKTLHYLMEHAGTVVSRDEIVKKAWGVHSEDFGNIVDVHIRNIRSKIDDGHKKKLIRTVHGLGYSVEE